MSKRLLTETLNEKADAINEKIGVKVKLPKGTVSRQKTSSVVSGVLGTGILVTGVIVASAGTTILGTLVVGANILSYINARQVEKNK